MRWRPGERSAIDGCLQEQEVEECLQWWHGKEAAFVLYVNSGRIVVMLSELVVQFPLLGAWIHLTSPSMMYTTPCSIYVSWRTKSCYLHNCTTSWPRLNIEHDEE
ncbi:hypothetical protein ACQJBY_004588 [Aegilops geniculata]